MARVDKTESAIGVTRGTLKEAFVEADYGKVIGVGIDSAGLTVKGAGQSGVVGVVIPDRTNSKAGARADIFGNGSEIIFGDNELLVAGTAYYVANATGALTVTAAAGTKVGFTVEADRLVVTL